MIGKTETRDYSARFSSPQETRFSGPGNSAHPDRRAYSAAGGRAHTASFPARLPMNEGNHGVADNDSIVKKVFDRVAAASGLVILAPIMLMVAALIYVSNPGPVLFAHERIGKHGRRFKCVKFRTMVMDGDAVLAQHLRNNTDAAEEWRATRKLQDDPRVTPLGDTLRRTSIDELPQLFNILAGQMSVVGPRPITDSEADYYGNAIYDYVSVRPGLTGLWQVSGRSDVGYGERVALDTDYVRNRSMRRDLAIILRTVKVVALREGSY